MTWILNSERSEMIDSRRIRRACIVNATQKTTKLMIIPEVGTSIVFETFDNEEDAKYALEKLTQALAEDFPGYVIRKRDNDLSFLIRGGKTDE